MVIVYKLRDDVEYIKQVQKATLECNDFGIQQTHGLFGSPNWWKNIEEGKLPVHTLRGTISRGYMGSMGDWPEFQVTNQDDASTESFTRRCHTRDQDAEYQVGRKIEIDYVWQKFKERSFFGSIDTKVILEIRIYDADS